jgi:hypothetical protein
MDQVGNWAHVKLDLNGDGDYADADESDDDRTHNDVNELTGRDTDDDGTDDYTLVYDEAGNLIDDGENYKYEYDAWYRLRKVNDQSGALVAEHRYNGLGHRIDEHTDTDTDGDVDGDDDWHHFVYDERWRVAAMFVDSDASPTEEFLPQNAGAGGRGGASYIDEVALRDRDTDDNGILDERAWYCQNRRYDVVALVDDGGDQREMVRYSAYGVPFGLVGGDADSDGDNDATDQSVIQGWIDASSYDARGDLDLDGDVDSADKGIAGSSPHSSRSSGWGILTGVGANAIGYQGLAIEAGDGWHARTRSHSAALGVWTQRDPWAYSDSAGLYTHNQSNLLVHLDPHGLIATANLPSDLGFCLPSPPDVIGGSDIGGHQFGPAVEGPFGYWFRLRLDGYVVNSLVAGDCEWLFPCEWDLKLQFQIMYCESSEDTCNWRRADTSTAEGCFIFDLWHHIGAKPGEKWPRWTGPGAGAGLDGNSNPRIQNATAEAWCGGAEILHYTGCTPRGYCISINVGVSCDPLCGQGDF